MDPERVQIENLLERYCWTVDHRQWEEWARCFTENAVFSIDEEELMGREAIRSYVEKNLSGYRLMRHLLHHPSIEMLGPSQAVVRAYFELRGITGRGREVEALGAYEDEVVKTEEGWQFKLRRVRFDYFVRRGEPWQRGGDA